MITKRRVKLKCSPAILWHEISDRSKPDRIPCYKSVSNEKICLFCHLFQRQVQHWGAVLLSGSLSSLCCSQGTIPWQLLTDSETRSEHGQNEELKFTLTDDLVKLKILVNLWYLLSLNQGGRRRGIKRVSESDPHIGVCAWHWCFTLDRALAMCLFYRDGLKQWSNLRPRVNKCVFFLFSGLNFKPTEGSWLYISNRNLFEMCG